MVSVGNSIATGKRSEAEKNPKKSALLKTEKMSEGENVIVAVRVRPFNDREKDRNAQLIIQMPDGQITEIRDPNDPNAEPKRFTFDHSYWSHNGFKTVNGVNTATNNKYADQGMLDNAWKGYNCSLFAYGQTGSGKSYSIVGFGKNKGIVPMVCEELFKRIDGSKEKGQTEYQVSLSMLEIYREKIRDLLSRKPPPTGGLKLRENPKTGFYVEGLSSSPVSNYKEIEEKINEGTKTRTIAATNMNATSSRAHTIVKIQFVQKSPKSDGKGTTKTSEINLVDLAGSERQKDAGSEGDRLKEGIVINQSLSTLGRVIKALVDKQQSKGRTVQIPYRDSVLTSLLKNALGGNSKTIMIAAISPADINYEETLSTLRFADRAKSIKTKAVVNESATERMIRELREENDRLQTMIKKGGDGGTGSQEELENLKRQLEENQKAMEELEKSWQQRLEEERRKHGGEDRSRIEERKKTEPYMWNLNEDPALTDMIVHFIGEGENRVGNGQGQHPTAIQLKGLSILPDHAIIRNKDGKKFTIAPLKTSEILINGKQISTETTLNQNDRILFGGNHLYVFVNPKKGGVKTSQEITYDSAQTEIARNVGIAGGALGRGRRSKEDIILEEELINLLPNVYRANAMAKELKRNVQFEIVLMAPEIRGNTDGLTEILIRVNNRSDDTTFLWEKSQFMNRYYEMQEMYQNYVENDPHWNDKDPFMEASNSSVDIGTVTVFLRSLAYLVEQDEQHPIVDIQGAETGQLSVALTPCNSNGKEILGEFVEDPKELIGKNLGFKVKILAAHGLPRRINESWCRYRFFDKEETVTSKGKGNNPAFSHEQLFAFRPVDQKLVDYLKDEAVVITICGTQRSRDSKTHSDEAVREINGYVNSEKSPPAEKKNPSKTRRRASVKPNTNEKPKPANGTTPKPPSANTSEQKPPSNPTKRETSAKPEKKRSQSKRRTKSASSRKKEEKQRSASVKSTKQKTPKKKKSVKKQNSSAQA